MASACRITNGLASDRRWLTARHASTSASYAAPGDLRGGVGGATGEAESRCD
jgi:hypothetical protein